MLHTGVDSRSSGWHHQTAARRLRGGGDQGGLRGRPRRERAQRRRAARMCQIGRPHPAGLAACPSRPIQRSSSARTSTASAGTYARSTWQRLHAGPRKPEGVRQMEETMSAEERAQRTLEHARSRSAWRRPWK
ncbi:hypothetical protein QJS66_14170 [Kocuria rhizophila]|nr:hypothetical protein QJS66_14170 [Kocuria rhizophila]